MILEKSTDAEFITELNVKKPELWSPQRPNLYTLETEIIRKGKIIDKKITRIGIKTIEFKGQDFYLNGEKTFFRGTNRHQEYPFIGYALSDNAQYRDAWKIKQAGFNFVRLSHYPQSTTFLDACDELGITVMDAILGWQFFGDSVFQENSYNDRGTVLPRWLD